MATIIEVQENKIDHLSEYAEKIVKYGKELLSCIEGMQNEKYDERYGKGRRSGYRHDPEWEERKPEYPRYY